MEAIILAGGLGTRLAGNLQGIPKPMAPIRGRPFLEILLNQLLRSGCSRVILSVGHLHSVITDHFGSSYRGIDLVYSIEQKPLGTGGATRAALRLSSEDNVLLLNGDTYLQVDHAAMLRFHESEGSQLTMAVRYQEDVSRYGCVLHEGARVLGLEEKPGSGPGWINAGSYVLSRELPWPQTLPERFSLERDFLSKESGRLAFSAFRVDGYFLDIGVPSDLGRAQTELAALVQ